MQTLKIIPVSDISIIQNYRDVNPPTVTDPDVVELSSSLQKHGVMQAVLVRPKTTKPGHYELIFGHRRLMACQVAGITEIPANVKEVADEDILEFQVTENLQRKDVHPMDEAIAFKHLMEAKKITVEEVAARFAKKPEYIMQRLSLNSLIQDLQKIFKQNKMLTGHAVLLSRLSENDQKEVKKDRFYGDQGFGAIANLADYIDRHVRRDLSKTGFKLDDAKIYPAAGACTSCPKRSGYNRLLFADINPKDDHCFDKSCFELKSAAGFQIKMREIVETRPEVHIVRKRYGQDPAKSTLATVKELKLKVLEENKDFDDYNYGKFKKKALGFYINGNDTGSIKTIYLPGPAVKSKDGKPVEEDPAEQIKKINDREKRAKELDLEKVHASMLTTIQNVDAITSPGFPFQPIDSAFLIYLLIHEAAGYHAQEKIKKHLQWLPKEPGYNQHGYQFEYIKKLGVCSPDDLAFILRTIIMEKYGSVNVQSVRKQDTLTRLIAEYIGINLGKIETAQQEIATKRQGRVSQRIALLKNQIKEKSVKKVVKKTSKDSISSSSKTGKKKAQSI